MPNESSSRKEIHTHHTVLPEVETLLSVQTAPNAVCSLFHGETEGIPLRLDADDLGVVRFHARAQKAWKPIEIHLEYASEHGGKVRHTLSLRGDHNHNAPITANEVRHGATGGLRPPLDPSLMELPNRELIALGYPPRPDPRQSPARYARWRRIVSQPFQAVNPRVVERPDIMHSRPVQLKSPTLPLPPPQAGAMNNFPLNNWSGPILTNPQGQFYAIQADWSVPDVFALPGAPFISAASEWVGFDNSPTDLYQAGSWSQCNNYAVFGFGWAITSYSIWVELLPFSAYFLPNFAVSPRDSVSVDIFVADQNGTTWFQNGDNGGLTPADNSVWFLIYNYTQGQSFWGTYSTAPVSSGGQSSTGFTGTLAEFILERPSLSSGTLPLASFGIAGMNNCWYADSFYGEQYFSLGADGSSPFDGSLAYYDMQNQATNNSLDLTFSSPDSNTGGSQVAFIWTNYL